MNTKRFTRPSDTSLVKELVESLVKKFSSQWKEETERQKSMSVRAREILLRWGEFSNEYVKEARLLKQENEESGWMWWSLGKVVGLSIVGPTAAILPFVLKITDDCVECLVGHSVWMGGMIPLFSPLTQIFSSLNQRDISYSHRFCACYSGRSSVELRISFYSSWMAYASVLLVLYCCKWFSYISISTYVE